MARRRDALEGNLAFRAADFDDETSELQEAMESNPDQEVEHPLRDKVDLPRDVLDSVENQEPTLALADTPRRNPRVIESAVREASKDDFPHASPSLSDESLAAYRRHNEALAERLTEPGILRDFAGAAYAREITPELVNQLFFDGKAAEWNYLPPTGDEQADFLAHAESVKRRANLVEAQVLWRSGYDQSDTDPQALNAYVGSQVNQFVKDEMLRTCPNNPPEGLHHPNPMVNEAWEAHWRQARDTVHAGTDPHSLYFINQIQNEAAQEYRETGKLPEWLDETRFTEETTYVSPELAAAGYSVLHNTPVDMLDSTANIENYLRRQMETHVQHHNRSSLGAEPADFARALLQPELDPELSGQWHRFDPGNTYLTDDGPINYRENLMVDFLVDPSADGTQASTHFEVSYARMTRDALMLKGMADDAYMNRPDLLAMSYPRNAAALRRMSEFAGETTALAEQPGWQPPQVQGYRPLFDWQSNPATDREQVSSLTRDFTSVSEISERIEDATAAIHGHFNAHDLVPQESWADNYAFIPSRADPGDRDTDFPGAVLIREALTDLREAQEMLDWCRHAEAMELLTEAAMENRGEEVLESLASDISLEVLLDALSRAEAEPSVAEASALRANPDDPDGAEGARIYAELTYDRHQQMFDEIDPAAEAMRAVDRLRHADFCIKMAAQAYAGADR